MPGADPHDTDALVIGGGIAGAAAAWSLARHMRVTLVEREPVVGHHATGRSASVLSETSGLAAVCELAAASRAFFEQPPDGFCDTPLVSPRGLLWIGRADDGELLDALHQRALGVAAGVRRLTANETQERLAHFRSDAIAGGAVEEPHAMAVDTAALLQSYISGIRRQGGTVITTAEALTGQRSNNTWTTRVGEIEIQSPVIVNAAGAWGDDIAVRCGVAPVGLHPLRRTAALVPIAAEVGSWPLVMDIAGRYYLEPESGGLLISAADETISPPCDARAEELDVALAIERVNEATDLAIRSVHSTWAGLRTFAADRIPVVGQDPHAAGFWWLVGQGGAGIKTAPALGALVAAQIIGDDRSGATAQTDSQLSPSRFR